jgi:hypothetical protein
MKDLVYGVGFNGRKYPAKVKGKITQEYLLWHNLLSRCYNPKYKIRQPTYLGCSISENFKNYSYFYDWCQNQVGFGRESFHLDKDLIFKGNKLYSEETCLFLPRELNNLLTSSKAARGSLPVGVSAHKGKFQAECCTHKIFPYIGLFNTPELAFQAYKEVKEAFIKAQAEKWKAFIDPRAYQALMVYEVSITD